MDSTNAGSTGCVAPGGLDTECEGEEPEESSSHSDEPSDVFETLESLTLQDNSESQNKDREDELSLFRQQWQRELESTPTPQRELCPKPEKPKEPEEPEEPESDEDRAKRLFLRGVDYERSGKLYEAIQHYKRAIQIMPDVEARLYESSELRAPTPDEESMEETARAHSESESEDEDAVEGEDLLARLQRVIARRGTLLEQEFPARGGHLSWLPYEVLQLVLRWVVSADLDAAALERVAAASRGLYVAARDQDIWRSLCVRTWGIECGTPRAGGFGSWRAMFVERPRLQLHGCYISKTTYLRHGENSFQDQFYRPWYLVDYYRYLRFFPEGLVLMWTTAEEPAGCVAQLRPRQPRPGLGIQAGHYRLMGTKVAVVIKKTSENNKKTTQATNTRFRARRKETPDQHEQTFHMEFELRAVRGRRNHQLAWRRYAVCTRRDQWTNFELSANKFPPFAFSAVRAYTADAAAPLNTHND